MAAYGAAGEGSSATAGGCPVAGAAILDTPLSILRGLTPSFSVFTESEDRSLREFELKEAFLELGGTMTFAPPRDDATMAALVAGPRKMLSDADGPNAYPVMKDGASGRGTGRAADPPPVPPRPNVRARPNAPPPGPPVVGEEPTPPLLLGRPDFFFLPLSTVLLFESASCDSE